MTSIRDLIKKQLINIKGDFVISTSGGIDSCSILISALDLGFRPMISSFTLEDRLSNDFRCARLIARHYDLEFIPIFLSVDKRKILEDVSYVIKHYGAKKKTAIECLYPRLHSLRMLKSKGIKTFVTGDAADGHFALSKKAMIHFKEPKEKFQKFRKEYFDNPDTAQVATIKRIASDFDIEVITPYFNEDVFDLFSNSSWSDLNKPRQKEAIRKHFPELNKFKIKPHTNLQLGDSGIAATVGEAVRSMVSPKAKSPITAYNILSKQ